MRCPEFTWQLGVFWKIKQPTACKYKTASFCCGNGGLESQRIFHSSGSLKSFEVELLIVSAPAAYLKVPIASG